MSSVVTDSKNAPSIPFSSSLLAYGAYGTPRALTASATCAEDNCVVAGSNGVTAALDPEAPIVWICWLGFALARSTFRSRSSPLVNKSSLLYLIKIHVNRTTQNLVHFLLSSYGRGLRSQFTSSAHPIAPSTPTIQSWGRPSEEPRPGHQRLFAPAARATWAAVRRATSFTRFDSSCWRPI